MPEHLVVVIPTINEMESTRALVSQLGSIRQQLPLALSVVYVDGESTDGTRELLQQLDGELEWITVLYQEGRSGLGAAYALGMKYAMDELHADFILEFDGDLQHRPEDIPALLEKRRDFDYVIGSRFIEGGSIPADWGIDRVALSRGGNLLARFMLGQLQIQDVTSGFKLSRVKGFLDEFNFETLYSTRHAYKIHLLGYMLEKGARISEVPITFRPRAAGESKLIKNDIFDTLRVLLLLRLFGASSKEPHSQNK